MWVLSLDKLSSLLWVHKYRVKNIDDLILSENQKIKFNEYIEKKEIPHILIYGDPGSGKSSLCQILIQIGIIVYNKDNILHFNGSTKLSRSISFIDEIVEPYLKSTPIGSDKIKIVYIDEADRMTPQSFDAYRGIIETYEKNNRFLLTANNISSFPDAFLSRFQTFKFNKIPINYVIEYCQNILKNENIEYNNNDLNFIVKELYPDVRKIVNTLEKNTIKDKLILDANSNLTIEKELIDNIIELIFSVKREEKEKINKYINTVVQILDDNNDLDFKNVYESLFFNNQIPVPAKIVINEFSNSHNNYSVPKMHIMSMIFKIIKSLNGAK